MKTERTVLLCGGAVVDCIVKPFDTDQRGASRTSLPGTARVSNGGVARNIAETIARLGGMTQLLSALGDDEAGGQVVASAQKLGIGVDHILRVPGGRTATFTALLDGSGDLVGAVADMEIFEKATPSALQPHVSSCSKSAGLIVCDANLSAESLASVRKNAKAVDVPAWFEPVSVAKARRGLPDPELPWHLVSPNWDELQAMLGVSDPVPIVQTVCDRLPHEVLDSLEKALCNRISHHILLTMGARGLVLASGSISIQSEFPAQRLVIDPVSLLGGQAQVDLPRIELEVVHVNASAGRLLWYRLLRPLEQVRDSTGAGDSLLAGTARAFSQGWPIENAVVLGMLCAHVTLFVPGANASFLCPEVVERMANLSRSRL